MGDLVTFIALHSFFIFFIQDSKCPVTTISKGSTWIQFSQLVCFSIVDLNLIGGRNRLDHHHLNQPFLFTPEIKTENFRKVIGRKSR